MIYSIVAMFLVFMLQEPFSSSAAILAMRQNGFDILYIHIIYVVATATDILIGYWLGSRFKSLLFVSRAIEKLNATKERYPSFSKYFPRRVALLLLGSFFFPLTIILVPSFGFSFLETFIVLLVGETILWYIPVSFIAYSLDNFIPAGHTTQIFGALMTLCVFSILFKIFKKRE